MPEPMFLRDASGDVYACGAEPGKDGPVARFVLAEDPNTDDRVYPVLLTPNNGRALRDWLDQWLAEQGQEGEASHAS